MNFYSAASCWIPDLIVESGWIDHAPFAFWITEALQPRTFVELGTHRGYSYFVFNQAIKQLGVKTRSFAIDTWAGDEHAGFFGDEVFQQVEAHNNEHYGDFSELIRSTFDDAVFRFTDGSLDLLHIDGRHFYEDIKHDFETWKGKLSTRGVVLIHDTNVRVRDFGVYRMWEELSAQYPSFEFLHGHGLGVLALGEEVPEVIRQLCDVSKDAARTLTIRALYSRLGKAIPKVAIQRPIEQMHTGDQELQKLTQEVQKLKQDIQSRDDQIAKLKEEEFTRRRLILESFGTQQECLKLELEQVRTGHQLGLEQVRANHQLELDQVRADHQLELDQVRADHEKDKILLEAIREELKIVDQKAASLAFYKVEYEKAVSSRSWKLTKPLRGKKFLRRRLSDTVEHG